MGTRQSELLTSKPSLREKTLRCLTSADRLSFRNTLFKSVQVWKMEK